MKKIISMLALLALVAGLSGCLDPQDESGGRPKSSVAVVIQ